MSFNFTFPGGKKKEETITATAGNAVTTLTVPAGKIWLVLRGKIRLTTDGNAANRITTITFDDGTTVDFENIWSVVTASSTNIDKIFWRGGFSTNTKYISIPSLSILQAGDRLKITITAGVAGDSYTGIITYLEIDAP